MKLSSSSVPPQWITPESTIAPYTLESLTGARVLVLAPHPDDEVFGCGGALRLHTQAGDPVKVVVMTDGRSGHGDQPVEAHALVKKRQEESRASAAVLGVQDIEFWPILDRTLGQAPDASERLAALLDLYKPDLIYAPSPLELHPDHRAAAWILWQLSAQLPRETMVAFYEISRPIAVNTLIDIDAVVHEKQQAGNRHHSQIAVRNYTELVQGFNRYRSFTVTSEAKFVEGYFVTPAANMTIDGIGLFHEWQLNPLRYQQIHVDPHVSVIVRTRNRPALLREALVSLLGQSGMELEVVIVNDGGSPVEAIINEFRPSLNIQQIEHPESRGRATAANSGLRASRGRYVAFLDDDDTYFEGHLNKLASYLDATGDHIAYSDVIVRNDTDVETPMKVSTFENGYDPVYLRLQNFLPIHAVMFRRSILEEVGLFDESFGALEDWDFWIRASRHYYFHRLPGITACYRFHAVHTYDWKEWHRKIYAKHHQPDELVDEAYRLVERCKMLTQALHYKEEAAQSAIDTIYAMKDTLVWKCGAAITRCFPRTLLKACQRRLFRRRNQSSASTPE